MKVRFKEPYAETTNGRLSYELVSDEPEMWFDEVDENYCLCYHTKILGYVNVERLEVTEDESDLPAIEIVIQLSNL